MKPRRGSPRSISIALAGIVACTLALAIADDGEGTVAIALQDAGGDPVTGCALRVLVLDGAGTTIGRVEHPPSPDGIYEVAAGPGQHLVLDAADDTRSFRTAKVTVPQSLEGALPVTVTGVPANDECSGAIPLAVGVVVDGTTTGASVDQSPECPADQGPKATVTAPGVWYTVTGNGNKLNATTCPTVDPASGASYDTKISVYCLGCDVQNCVDGNDDHVGCSPAFRSNATWCSLEGVEYHILVHGFQDQTGDFTMSVFDDGPCTEEPTPCILATPTGACCNCLNEPYNCEVTTRVDCEAKTGHMADDPTIGYQGDGVSCLVTTDTTSVSSFPELPIPTAEPWGSDSIEFTGAGLVADLDVAIVITHTWAGDVSARLTHEESGLSALLIDRPNKPSLPGEGCGADNVDAVLDDEGTGGPIEMVCGVLVNPSSPPNFTPNEPLSVFDGMPAEGTWTLTVFDGEPTFDDGTLNSWSLILTEGVSTCADTTGGLDSVPCPLLFAPSYTICHVPPGNPGAAHTIEIDNSALESHLAHGDLCEPCSTDGGDDGQWDGGVDGEPGAGANSTQSLQAAPPG